LKSWYSAEERSWTDDSSPWPEKLSSVPAVPRLDPEEVDTAALARVDGRLSSLGSNPETMSNHEAVLFDMDGVTVSVAEFEALYDDRAGEVYRGHATLLPGYRELLMTLRTAGYATGLVSASRREWVSMVLERFDLAELYDAVVSASDVEGPSKPDPRTYLVAAEQVGVDSTDCIAVEDSPHGLEAALEAGMDCLALRGAGNADDDLSAADRVVASAAELRAVLSEWDVIDDQ
jgi:HAD superfamily hydrolase (TIGR01509 family)